METGKFLEVSKLVDETRATFDLAEVLFHNEGDQIQLFQKTKRIGQFTPRGLATLGKLVKASPGLLLNQAQHTMNEVIKRQLSGRKEVQILKDPTDADKITCIFPGNTVYTPYTDLLAGLTKEIHSVAGDPVSQDCISVLARAWEGDVLQNDKYIIGPHFTLSSTSLIKNRFSFGAFRLICTNGMVDSVWKTASLKNADNAVVKALAREYTENVGGYVKDLKETLRWAADRPLDRDLHLVTLKGVPRPVLDKHIAILEEPAVNLAEIKAAGLDAEKPKTVYHSFCLLEHLVKGCPTAKVRTRSEENVFGWMVGLKRMFGKN